MYFSCVKSPFKLGTQYTVHRIYTETGFTNYNFKSKNRVSRSQNVKKSLEKCSLGCLGQNIKKNLDRIQTVSRTPPQVRDRKTVSDTPPRGGVTKRPKKDQKKVPKIAGTFISKTSLSIKVTHPKRLQTHPRHGQTLPRQLFIIG